MGFRKSKESNNLSTDSTPLELAREFSRGSKRERQEGLDAFGHAAYKTFDWLEQNRPPAERGRPVSFSLLPDGQEGFVVEAGQVPGTVKGTIEPKPRPARAVRSYDINAGSLLMREKYISNYGLTSIEDDPELIVRFDVDDDDFHPGFAVRKKADGYGIETNGDDQYSRIGIGPAEVKSRGNKPQMGYVRMMGQAHLPQDQV